MKILIFMFFGLFLYMGIQFIRTVMVSGTRAKKMEKDFKKRGLKNITLEDMREWERKHPF